MPMTQRDDTHLCNFCNLENKAQEYERIPKTKHGEN